MILILTKEYKDSAEIDQFATSFSTIVPCQRHKSSSSAPHPAESLCQPTGGTSALPSLAAPIPHGSPLSAMRGQKTGGGNCQIIGSFHHLAGNSPPNPAHLMMPLRNTEPKDQVKLVQALEMFFPLPTPPLPGDENHPISGRSPPSVWQGKGNGRLTARPTSRAGWYHHRSIICERGNA